MKPRIIDLGDVDALDALPFDSVLLCRVGEVFQVKQSGLAENDRAWFALGYGDRIWRVEDVAAWGPLTVLWPLPEEPDVSRETFALPAAELDPRLVQLGTRVLALPRFPDDVAGTRGYLGAFVSRLRDIESKDLLARIVLDVDGERVVLLERDYSVQPVR